MLSLGATLVVSLSAASAVAGGSLGAATCADEPTSHLAAWIVTAATGGDADADAPEYASPLEVECPTPAAGALGLADATCDETPPPDLWYRISTPGASEHATTTLTAARRGHGGRATMVAGTPVPDTRQVAPPDLHPLALCAVPILLPSVFAAGISFAIGAPPARTVGPPERPPRV